VLEFVLTRDEHRTARGMFWTRKEFLILLARVRVRATSVGTRRKVYSVNKSSRTIESLVKLGSAHRGMTPRGSQLPVLGPRGRNATAFTISIRRASATRGIAVALKITRRLGSFFQRCPSRCVDTAACVHAVSTLVAARDAMIEAAMYGRYGTELRTAKTITVTALVRKRHR